jgi:hypothetical protein
VPLQSLRDKRLHTSRVELSPWKNTITPHCRDRQLQPGDLRRNNEQDFVSLTAPGIHHCAGAVSRFDGQDPERDRSTFAAIDQATLARFISEGFFLSHIKRMRKIYAERRDFFIKQFNELLGGRETEHECRLELRLHARSFRTIPHARARGRLDYSRLFYGLTIRRLIVRHPSGRDKAQPGLGQSGSGGQEQEPLTAEQILKQWRQSQGAEMRGDLQPR